MKACAIIVSFNHWHGDGQGDGTWAREFAHALQDKNPKLKVLVIDNCSQIPYTSTTLEIIRLQYRAGYAEALNIGLNAAAPLCYDWYITLNNDCQIKTGTTGDVIQVLETLDKNTLYGSGVNQDANLPFAWQWSAWMCISQKIFNHVGYFDNRLSAAFEDFDYQRRAMDRGYKLDTAYLPIEHLDMHTRYEDPTYPARWEASRMLFETKYNIGTTKWYTNQQIAKAENG